MNAMFQTPLHAMHPQIITWPLPCVTVARRFFWWSSVFGLRHTNFFPSDPKTLNLLSPENIIFCQNSIGLFGYVLANYSRFCLFISLMKGFFLGVLLHS
jgi:hypothetical protein